MLLITNYSRSIIHDVEGYDNHEKVFYCYDKESGLQSFIAIHNTKRGPALGGCRYWSYKRFDSEGLTDVLRLSRGMTFKSALAGLSLGGGKAVISKRHGVSQQIWEKQLRAFGRFVQTLEGEFVTGEDVGISVADMKIAAQETDYIVGIKPKETDDGTMRDGDPSPVTAYGVMVGIRSAVKHHFKLKTLSGIVVGIQGCGSVGSKLAEMLHSEGAKLYVTDIDVTLRERVAHEFGATPCDPDEIYSMPMDVFAPCALGAVINEDTFKILSANIIAGSANNQLKDHSFGQKLREKNILYAPDYVINSGGLIDVSYDHFNNFDRDDLFRRLGQIGTTLEEIFKRSDTEDRSTNDVAQSIAEERLVVPEKTKKTKKTKTSKKKK